MDLHMVQFIGTTFGMNVSGNTVAFRQMKKNVFKAEVKLQHRTLTKKMNCVKSKDLAAIMGDAGWLVSEQKCMKTVQWGDSDVHYIVYDS